MIDFNAALLGPVYGVLGTQARLKPKEGSSVLITVFDQTAGMLLNTGQVELTTIKPAATVRLHDLKAHGLTKADCLGATLTLSCIDWTVDDTQDEPGANGLASGELILTLVRA